MRAEPGSERADAGSRSNRRVALAMMLLGGVGFVVVAAVWVPWDWVPGGHLVPAKAEDVFTPAQLARAEVFSHTQRILGWASYAVSLAVALVLGLTPLGAWLVRRVGPSTRRRGGRAAQVVLGTGALLLVGRLATLPFALALRSRELDYGLTAQPLAGWVRDYLVSFAVGWVVTALALVVLVGVARRWRRAWPAIAGVLAAALVVLGSFAYPVVIEPLFNDFAPMKPGPFKTSVFKLAQDEGVHIDDVLVSDASRRTTTLNAYVSGFGDTRRVVVYDNTLADLSPEQARVVIAHELAHAKHHDVALGTGLGALGAVFGVGLLALLVQRHWLLRRAGAAGPGDPGVVALVLALVAVGTLLASPVQDTASRAIEARADRDSLAVTGAGESFVAMQRALAVHALHDPTPPAWSQFWFGTHPTVLQRVGLLDSTDG